MKSYKRARVRDNDSSLQKMNKLFLLPLTPLVYAAPWTVIVPGVRALTNAIRHFSPAGSGTTGSKPLFNPISAADLQDVRERCGKSPFISQLLRVRTTTDRRCRLARASPATRFEREQSCDRRLPVDGVLEVIFLGGDASRRVLAASPIVGQIRQAERTTLTAQCVEPPSSVKGRWQSIVSH